MWTWSRLPSYHFLVLIDLGCLIMLLISLLSALCGSFNIFLWFLWILCSYLLWITLDHWLQRLYLLLILRNYLSICCNLLPTLKLDVCLSCDLSLSHRCLIFIPINKHIFIVIIVVGKRLLWLAIQDSRSLNLLDTLVSNFSVNCIVCLIFACLSHLNNSRVLLWIRNSSLTLWIIV